MGLPSRARTNAHRYANGVSTTEAKSPLPDTFGRVWPGRFASFVLFSLWAAQAWRNLLGWWGFGALAVAVTAVAAVLLVRYRPQLSWRHQPKTVYLFLLVAALSLAWSAYPAASLLAVAAQAATVLVAATLGLILSWSELLRALGSAFRWLLGLSLLFELWVSLFVRAPLLPNFLELAPGAKIPKAFYWSRELLFAGGPIEGIVGNRNLLGFIALLALIVFAVQLAAGTVGRVAGWIWVCVAVAMLLLTRSATVTVAIPIVALVLLLALWARRRGERSRLPVYVTAIAALGGIVATVSLASPLVLRVLGKSSDLTNRFEIWGAVIGLAEQRPVAGWGWTSYWQPWAEPLGSLVRIKGVSYLQAHNAWLDLWLQLGVIGLIAFAMLALSVLGRSWFLAVDRPQSELAPGQLRASALLPLLLIVALLVQSLAESRLLYEANFALLVLLAFATKRRGFGTEEMP